MIENIAYVSNVLEIIGLIEQHVYRLKGAKLGGSNCIPLRSFCVCSSRPSSFGRHIIHRPRRLANSVHNTLLQIHGSSDEHSDAYVAN